MKFDSGQDYIDSFRTRLRSVSGRDEAEKEVTADVARLDNLRKQIRRAADKRDAEIARAKAAVGATAGKGPTRFGRLVLHILKPRAAAELRELEAEIAKLKARRARLFGTELPLDGCLKRIDELSAAARTVRSRIEQGRQSHVWSLKRKQEERAARRAARELSLEPYRKRIELGEAALGRTRIVASGRKKKLSRSYPCPYCGGPLGRAPVADHIYPVARGGLSTDDNMVYACLPCNQKKRDFTLVEFAHKYSLDITKIHERLIRQRKRF